MQNLRWVPSLFLLFTTCLLQAQHLQFSPAKPVAGETVTITYDQAASPFAKDAKFRIAACAVDADQLTVTDVAVTVKDGKLTGQYVVPASAKAVYFVPRSTQSDEEDNNGGQGYGTAVYQANRQTPVAGYELTRAAIAGRHFSALRLERNEPEALRLMGEQFAAMKSNTALLTAYAYIANRNKSQEAQAQLKGFVQQTLDNPKAGEDALETALNLSDALEDEELMEAATAKMKKRFPKGKVLWYEKSKGFFDGGMSPDEQKAAVDALAALPKTKSMEDMFGSMVYRVAGSALRSGDMAVFEKYSKMIPNRVMRASLYNSLAWKEAGEGLEEPAGNLDLARKYSLESLQLVEAAMNAPTQAEMYTGYTPGEMKEILQGNYAMFSDSYALALYRSGQEKEALKYQQIACEGQQFKDTETNERYCLYLEKVEGAAKALAATEKFISEGTASPAVKAQFKRLFATSLSSEQAADKYMALLEKEGKVKLLEELKKKMVDEDAPTFALRNLAGETVALESLKGKVVVLDFWATWCGPCISSFPGMQRAQDAHKERGDVVFLFVDTWENGDNKEKNASEFIAKNKYTFNVLMDNDNAVVGKYKVEGIPTKFILDRNGRIRFKSVGYSGNPDALVDEMAFMIELAGQ